MTHSLDDLEPLDDDLDDHEHDGQSTTTGSQHPDRSSTPERARRTTKHHRATTREHLLELIDHALGAKLGHDVGRLPVTLDHLHQVAAIAHTIAAAVAAQQTNINPEDTP